MIPVLYAENEAAFQTNGIGRLADAISCTVKQDKSGTFELSMEYPLDGIHAGEITGNRFIYAVPERGKGPQPFRIRNTEKKLDGKIRVTARHVCYDLAYYACKQFGQTGVLPYKAAPVLCDSAKRIIGSLDRAERVNTRSQFLKWALTFNYPSQPPSDACLAGLVAGNFILSQPTLNKEYVYFEITSVTPDSGSGFVGVTAEALKSSYDPTVYNNMTVEQALINIALNTAYVQQCPFTFSAVPLAADDEWITSVHEFSHNIPKPVKTIMQGDKGSVTEVFGGEWEFDHFSCILHEKRGSDNGVQYRYGKNITGISERVNIDSIYTHAFSYWKGTASSSTESEDGEYYTVMGNQQSILEPGFESMFPSQRTLIIDASGEFEDKPIFADLDNYTLRYVKESGSGTPTVTIKVSIVDLAGAEEYEDIADLEQVNLYDTVTVLFPAFGINIKSTVTEIEYDVLKGRNSKVTIGDVTTDLSNIIARNARDITRTKNDLMQWADKAMERSTEALAGWRGGNIRKNYNKSDHKQQSMYIMDEDDMEAAENCIRFDEDGIAVSTDGTDGEYGYMINMRGGTVEFSDSFATDGDTNGSFLKRGAINSGNNSWDLENDTVSFDFSGTAAVFDTLTASSDIIVLGNLSVGAQGKDVESWIDSLDRRVRALEGS